jgi:hypothetical protein
MPRDFATDAALRPQPKRSGLDNWATPACLLAALVYDVLPTLPDGPVWEPAPGAGALADAITATGRTVITTSDDFLHHPLPDRVRILATNPPFNQHSAFIQRALYLLDSNELDAAVLLFRHDHLQSESRTPPHCRLEALQRSTQIFVCPWRPTWIAGTAGNGRWSFSWVLWQRTAAPRRPVWLKCRTKQSEHSSAPGRADLVDRCGTRPAAGLVVDRHAPRNS